MLKEVRFVLTGTGADILWQLTHAGAQETLKHTSEEEVGRYRSSSVTPVSQPNVLALARGGRTQYLHSL